FRQFDSTVVIGYLSCCGQNLEVDDSIPNLSSSRGVMCSGYPSESSGFGLEEKEAAGKEGSSGVNMHVDGVRPIEA
ncbi:hypothetical protein B296_00011587, partial [Ensete ventricosum]